MFTCFKIENFLEMFNFNKEFVKFVINYVKVKKLAEFLTILVRKVFRLIILSLLNFSLMLFFMIIKNFNSFDSIFYIHS